MHQSLFRLSAAPARTRLARMIRAVALPLAFLVAALGAPTPSRAAAGPGALSAYELRCDWAVDPVGVDSSPPRLSWKLRGEGRALTQSAWQVLAASSRTILDAGRGDLWDSGRVEGGAQVHVPYAGRPLQSHERVFWKVRAWDGAGRAGAWSQEATWTMGVLAPGDWRAKWITHAALLAIARPHLGYRSEDAAETLSPKWIQIDLGSVYPIDEVRLHALRHTVAERLGFPRRFKVEVSRDPGFAAGAVLLDTTDNPANTWLTRHVIPGGGVEARHLRLSAPELRDLDGTICLAFNQIEVISGGRNVAVGAAVTASDSIEAGPWSASAVVDGRGVPGGNPVATQTVALRREFRAGPGLRRALVHVCGLGQYVMTLNGAQVGDAFLSPGWTDTDKTCLYDSFDVTSRVREGTNAIGLTLAGGMYNVPDPGGRYTKFVGRYRPLKAIVHMRLEYADGSAERVVSDESWRSRAGATTYSHIFGGEDHDAGLEPAGWTSAGFDDREWAPAVVPEAPGGRLCGVSHAAPPLRRFDVLEPVAVKEIRPGVTVHDLGQNAAQTIELAVRGPRGSRVRVTPAELIHPDGTIDRGSVGRGGAWWQLTLAGTGGEETWQPEFFYHGARYLQVERLPAEGDGAMPNVVRIAGRATHSGSAPAGGFESSSDLFNRTRTLVRWAQRSNMVSVLTDCPHRERLGWLEQYHLNGPSLRYEFDVARLYLKTFGDMADAQTAGGLVPDIAPEYIVFEGAFRDSPEWGSALILAAWQHFLFTGDDTVFARHYDAMRRYFDYLAGRSKEGMLDHGLGDWYDLGPNPPGVSQLTPIALTATATWFEDARVLAAIARRLGKTDDAVLFEKRAAEIREAFNRTFFDASRGSYAGGSQTANAMPYALGMTPEGRKGDVLAAIVADVRERGNAFTAGDVGHRYLLRALADGGRSDVVFDMHHQSDRPGYGYQLARGATSLTEAWDARRGPSQNHFMLGHITEWFYADLAGIRPDPEAPGFGRVIIDPQPAGDISWVAAHHESPRGRIAVRWERAGPRFTLRVEIPANTSATVRVPSTPGAELLEGGRRADRQPGVTLLRREEDRAVFSVGSGEYVFESTP